MKTSSGASSARQEVAFAWSRFKSRSMRNVTLLKNLDDDKNHQAWGRLQHNYDLSWVIWRSCSKAARRPISFPSGPYGTTVLPEPKLVVDDLHGADRSGFRRRPTRVDMNCRHAGVEDHGSQGTGPIRNHRAGKPCGRPPCPEAGRPDPPLPSRAKPVQGHGRPSRPRLRHPLCRDRPATRSAHDDFQNIFSEPGSVPRA